MTLASASPAGYRDSVTDTYMPLGVAVESADDWKERKRDDEGKAEIVALLLDDDGAPISKPAFEAVLKARNRLRGGVGDKLTADDVNAEQLDMGDAVELEHTSDQGEAREIALDHLAEDPKYYTKLKRVEKGRVAGGGVGLSAGGFGPSAAFGQGSIRYPGQAGRLRSNAAAPTAPLDPSAVATLVGTLIAREIRLADNEIALRKAVTAALESRGIADFRTQKRIMAKAVATWRARNLGPHRLTPAVRKAHAPNTKTSAQGPPTQKTGPKLSAGRPKVPKLGSKPKLPHKVPIVGQGDPVRGPSRRALPPGAVRIHFSQSRNGYVRAMKMTDGTWKVLGKVHTNHVEDKHKKDAGKLHPKNEHKDSHPKGKAPIHDAGGNPVGKDGSRRPMTGT